MIQLYNGDCLFENEKIESGSVDLILTDLPYGTVKGAKFYDYCGGCDWDNSIDPIKVFNIANRILRKNGKMVLFSQEPYTSQLITNACRNVPFSYRMMWEKDNFANALLCNKAPVGMFEDILVFNKRSDVDNEGIHPLRPYFKLILEYTKLNLKQINSKLGHRKAEHTFYVNTPQYELCTEKTYDELIEVFHIDKMEGFKPYSELKAIDDKFKQQYASTFNLWEGGKYKSNILKYKKDYNGYHPTQKPVALLEDLIKTFSNEGDLVVDLTMGSGSTMVACKNTNRNGIGIELDKKFFNISQNRINQAKTDKASSLF